MTVWNERQREEAVELHASPPGARGGDRRAPATTTGSPGAPPRTREAFCARSGCTPAGRSCSTWARRRSSRRPRCRSCSAGSRPCGRRPTPPCASSACSSARTPRTAPVGGGGPADARARRGLAARRRRPGRRDVARDFYDSIHHCAAVVGINTSALIESAIVGRPVLTILDAEFARPQDGTLHFAHLQRAGGGCCRRRGARRARRAAGRALTVRTASRSATSASSRRSSARTGCGPPRRRSSPTPSSAPRRPGRCDGRARLPSASAGRRGARCRRFAGSPDGSRA